MVPSTILVGTDFSDTSRAALDWALDLAKKLGARVVIGHVYDLPLIGLPDASIMVDAETASRLSNDAQKALDNEVARVAKQGTVVEGLLRQGDARDALPELAGACKAGLLVVGSHGRRGLRRAVLGSVAESIVRTSPVPVVVVRRPV
jgi:nucleotide-binding universal stress UspA family protein